MSPLDQFIEYQIYLHIFKYVLPILVIIGTVGNIISLIVLLKPKHRHTSVGRVLTILSITDLCLLLVCAFNNLTVFVFGSDIRDSSNYACKILVFTAFSLGQLSALCIVILSVNRLISVCLPFKVKSICTLRNTNLSLAGAVAISVVVNCHALIGLGVNEQGDCVQIKEIYDLRPVKMWINLQIAFLFFTPIICVVIINVGIISTLLYKAKKSKLISSNAGRFQVNASKTTKVLCILCVVYLFSIAPLGLFNIMYDGKQLDYGTDHNDAVILLFYAVAFVAFCFNSSVNFLLYFLSGSKFRNDVKELFSVKKG
jgi:growth hormone secretagogue receptor